MWTSRHEPLDNERCAREASTTNESCYSADRPKLRQFFFFLFHWLVHGDSCRYTLRSGHAYSMRIICLAITTWASYLGGDYVEKTRGLRHLFAGCRKAGDACSSSGALHWTWAY